MQLFGQYLTSEHARLLLPLIGGVIAVGGFIAGRWSRHRSWVSFRHEDLVARSIVIELYGIQAQPDGSDMLHIVTQGGPYPLDRFFSSAELVAYIRREAEKHPGLLQLSRPIAHRMMMDEGKDMITGLDPRANIDFLNGRPTQDDETLFGFAAYRETSHDDTRLRDQIARLTLMVVSPSLIDQLADEEYIARLRVRHQGYRPRRARLHDFAREWKRMQALPQHERSRAVDKIWQVTVRTACR